MGGGPGSVHKKEPRGLLLHRRCCVSRRSRGREPPPRTELRARPPYLVEKVQAGADFIMTQLFFDVKAYENFESTLREHPSGAFKDIIIIPGLMPIQSYQMIKRTTKLSHAQIPDSVMGRLDAVKGDDEKVKMVGVDILCEQVEQLKVTKSRRDPVPKVSISTLNLEKAVSFIVERTNLVNPSDHAPGVGGGR